MEEVILNVGCRLGEDEDRGQVVFKGEMLANVTINGITIISKKS